MGAENKSAIATLVEPRYVILIPLENKDALRKSMERAFKNIPTFLKKLLSIQEMAEHKNSKMKVYFRPWQRGTNENTNVLIRQFFPKSTDFNKVSR